MPSVTGRETSSEIFASLDVGVPYEDAARDWVRTRAQERIVASQQSKASSPAVNFSEALRVLEDIIDTIELVLRVNKQSRDQNVTNRDQAAIIDIEPLHKYLEKIMTFLENNKDDESVKQVSRITDLYTELKVKAAAAEKKAAAEKAEAAAEKAAAHHTAGGGSRHRRRRIKRRKTRKSSKKSKRRKTKKKKRRTLKLKRRQQGGDDDLRKMKGSVQSFKPINYIRDDVEHWLAGEVQPIILGAEGEVSRLYAGAILSKTDIIAFINKVKNLIKEHSHPHRPDRKINSHIFTDHDFRENTEIINLISDPHTRPE